MKKVLLWLLILLISISMIAAFSLTGCKEAAEEVVPAEEVAEEEEEAAPAEEEVAEENMTDPVEIGKFFSNIDNTPIANDKYKIAYLVPTLTKYFPESIKGGEDVADKAGIELLVYDAGDDSSNQTSQIENVISLGVDFVVITPVEADALVPAVKKLNENDIPVIADNRDVTGGEKLAYCGTDDIVAGKALAELGVDALIEKNGEPKGKIVIIEGAPGSSPQINRHDASFELLEGYPDIEILEYNTTNTWAEEEARALMEGWLSKYSEIDLVLAQFDTLLWGAWYAADSIGRSEEMMFVSIGGYEQAIDWVKEGKTYGLIYQDPYAEGVCGVNLAIAYLNGNEIPSYVPVPVMEIKSENANSISGW